MKTELTAEQLARVLDLVSRLDPGEMGLVYDGAVGEWFWITQREGRWVKWPAEAQPKRQKVGEA